MKKQQKKDRKMVGRHEKNAKGSAKVAIISRNDHQISYDFIQNRESIYKLVDVIDSLFDTAIGL